eukprot:2929326-Rhodomonas_salina.1
MHTAPTRCSYQDELDAINVGGKGTTARARYLPYAMSRTRIADFGVWYRRVRYWHSRLLLSLVGYFVGDVRTDVASAGTRLLEEQFVNASGLMWDSLGTLPLSFYACHMRCPVVTYLLPPRDHRGVRPEQVRGQYRVSQPLSCYATARRCPAGGTTERRTARRGGGMAVLSAYACAKRCPVLRLRVLVPERRQYRPGCARCGTIRYRATRALPDVRYWPRLCCLA